MTIQEHRLIVKSIVHSSWVDETATQAFAEKLAAHSAVRQALIELRGDLGAGKTTFVRHLLKALGVQGRIKSPTYAVVEPYELSDSNLLIWHFDFYRFNDPREWEEAGFRDIFASPGLKLVEWPDKAGPYLPQPDLVIDIDMAENTTRNVTLTACTDIGAELLA